MEKIMLRRVSQVFENKKINNISDVYVVEPNKGFFSFWEKIGVSAVLTDIAVWKKVKNL